MPKIIAKTTSGFECEMDEQIFDDIELVEYLSEISEDPTVLPAIIQKALTKDDKKRLYDHCRNEQGRVPISRVFAELGELFNSTKEGKN